MALNINEINLVEQLRAINPSENIPSYTKSRGLSERLADKITGIVGSWRFLIIQSIILTFWVISNIAAFINHWAPYPFILLNLFLSFQAAYTAPIIMMSQNREGQIDRAKLEYYYNVNLKQELEIELLHQKFDQLFEHLKIENKILAE